MNTIDIIQIVLVLLAGAVAWTARKSALNSAKEAAAWENKFTLIEEANRDVIVELHRATETIEILTKENKHLNDECYRLDQIVNPQDYEPDSDETLADRMLAYELSIADEPTKLLACDECGNRSFKVEEWTSTCNENADIQFHKHCDDCLKKLFPEGMGKNL